MGSLTSSAQVVTYLIGPNKKILHTRTSFFKHVYRQKAILDILQHPLVFLIRPLLRHLFFLHMCYRIPAICLLWVLSFGFLLVCRFPSCPLHPLLLFLDSLTTRGGEAFGTRWCGILGQQMLCSNSETLHIADLIFAIKGINLSFRKG